MFYAKFGWNWSSRSGEEFKNMKCCQTDKEIQDGWQVIRKAHLIQLKWEKKIDCITRHPIPTPECKQNSETRKIIFAHFTDSLKLQTIYASQVTGIM